ncbi:hypothetical protein N7540_011148 [Penicillium herquei]|nr:hypothetical protein N7540_011148 [Penicillium herquei]
MFKVSASLSNVRGEEPRSPLLLVVGGRAMWVRVVLANIVSSQRRQTRSHERPGLMFTLTKAKSRTRQIITYQ